MRLTDNHVTPPTFHMINIGVPADVGSIATRDPVDLTLATSGRAVKRTIEQNRPDCRYAFPQQHSAAGLRG